jgi:hypothetical protein
MSESNSTLESTVSEIRKVYQLLFGKDCDVHITFKGTYLTGTPWHISIDNRESKGLVVQAAAANLLVGLKEELSKKISMLENEAKALRKALGNIAS